MTFSEIQSKIKIAKQLDFGTLFSQSIELYKRAWLQGFLLQLLTIALILPVILIFYFPFFMTLIEQSQSSTYNPEDMNNILMDFSPAYILGFYAIILVLSVVSSVLYVGFYRVLKKIDYNEGYKFLDFFYYFKGEYLLKILGVMFITFIIAIVATMLCVFPVFYVMVPLMFALPFLAFNPDWGIGDIISGSFALGNKKWGITFLILILTAIILYILSLFTFSIANLFVGSFIYVPVYIIYKEVVGFGEDHDEIMKIGEE
jgi:hypothetical protein